MKWSKQLSPSKLLLFLLDSVQFWYRKVDQYRFHQSAVSIIEVAFRLLQRKLGVLGDISMYVNLVGWLFP